MQKDRVNYNTLNWYRGLFHLELIPLLINIQLQDKIYEITKMLNDHNSLIPSNPMQSYFTFG